MFLIYSEDVLYETFVWGPNLISLHIKCSLKDNNIYVVKTDGKEGYYFEGGGFKSSSTQAPMIKPS